VAAKTTTQSSPAPQLCSFGTGLIFYNKPLHRKTIKSQKAKKHTAFAVCFRLSLSVKSNLYMKRLEGLSPNFYREAPDNFNAALQNQHCVNRRNLTVSVYIAEDFLLVGKLD